LKKTEEMKGRKGRWTINKKKRLGSQDNKHQHKPYKTTAQMIPQQTQWRRLPYPSTTFNAARSPQLPPDLHQHGAATQHGCYQQTAETTGSPSASTSTGLASKPNRHNQNTNPGT
jgi:hypothetical protein